MKIENPSKDFDVVKTYVSLNVKMGWMLNPNEKTVNGIIKGLIRCDGECPCANEGKTIEDRMCPCTSYRKHDKCCCGLYVLRPKPKL